MQDHWFTIAIKPRPLTMLAADVAERPGDLNDGGDVLVAALHRHQLWHQRHHRWQAPALLALWDSVRRPGQSMSAAKYLTG